MDDTNKPKQPPQMRVNRLNNPQSRAKRQKAIANAAERGRSHAEFERNFLEKVEQAKKRRSE